MMNLFFVSDYFHFWSTAFCSGIVSITNGVANGYLYSNDPSKIVIHSVILTVLMNFCTQFIIHLITTACGMLFVDAEVLRQGNDSLLDDLDEGVIIVDEATSKITFINRAAKE